MNWSQTPVRRIVGNIFIYQGWVSSEETYFQDGERNWKKLTFFRKKVKEMSG